MNTAVTDTKKKVGPLDLAYIGMFVALTAVCSWISIPASVPFTLQTFAIFAAIAILGMRRGTAAVLIYIIMGAVGIPVFAGFKGGFGVLLGTTGGYIIGFIFTALATGGILEKFGKKVFVMAAAMFLGMIIYYVFGTVWFLYVYTAANGPVELVSVLSWCVFPFIIPDLLKIALAIILEKRVSGFVR